MQLRSRSIPLPPTAENVPVSLKRSHSIFVDVAEMTGGDYPTFERAELTTGNLFEHTMGMRARAQSTMKKLAAGAGVRENMAGNDNDDSNHDDEAPPRHRDEIHGANDLDFDNNGTGGSGDEIDGGRPDRNAGAGGRDPPFSGADQSSASESASTANSPPQMAPLLIRSGIDPFHFPSRRPDDFDEVQRRLEAPRASRPPSPLTFDRYRRLFNGPYNENEAVVDHAWGQVLSHDAFAEPFLGAFGRSWAGFPGMEANGRQIQIALDFADSRLTDGLPADALARLGTAVQPTPDDGYMMPHFVAERRQACYATEAATHETALAGAIIVRGDRMVFDDVGAPFPGRTTRAISTAFTGPNVRIDAHYFDERSPLPYAHTVLGQYAACASYDEFLRARRAVRNALDLGREKSNEIYQMLLYGAPGGRRQPFHRGGADQAVGLTGTSAFGGVGPQPSLSPQPHPPPTPPSSMSPHPHAGPSDPQPRHYQQIAADFDSHRLMAAEGLLEVPTQQLPQPPARPNPEAELSRLYLRGWVCAGTSLARPQQQQQGPEPQQKRRRRHRQQLQQQQHDDEEEDPFTTPSRLSCGGPRFPRESIPVEALLPQPASQQQQQQQQ